MKNKVGQRIKPTAGSNDYSKPGEEVNVVVEAEKDSFLGIVAIDKSVKILKDLNDFTVNDIGRELGEYGKRTSWYSSNSFDIDYDRSVHGWDSKKIWHEDSNGCHEFGSADMLVMSNVCQRRREEEDRGVAYDSAGWWIRNFRNFC